MNFSRSTRLLQKISKTALAVSKKACYGICKFPIVNGGEPTALAVKALKLTALIPTFVGVSLSPSPTVTSCRSSKLLRHLSSHPNIKCYDSS